ncbi:MAG TPA: xanthine dehydrogenase family protein molybdopterin-binding subunit [Actinomycetota bacterium]|nr:xanthine dehydrogenase family protein molybdopterin-binding subunit [Actinomycetota bacterium]
MTASVPRGAVLRAEDPRFLRGAARYVEDVPAPGALRAAFVRSMMAHARLARVDVSAARAAPGVVAVLTADDLDLPPRPPSGNVDEAYGRPVLAREVARFVGEPIAVVLAEDRGTAADAAELVEVGYEPLPAVTDPEAAAEGGAPLLFPATGTNVAFEIAKGWDEDPLEGAEVVVRARVVSQRVAPVPMEPNAILAVPETDGLALWASTQVPFDVRTDVAEALGLEASRVRVVAPDVGGGFGAKLTVYPEYLVVAAAALRLGRPVRWAETRSESMLSLTHGRAQIHRVELGARRDGTLVGIRLDVLADLGAYPLASYLTTNSWRMATGAYRIPRVAFRSRVVATNAPPVGPYRGAGRPEPILAIERAMDLLAAELGVDPAELRRRNFVPPEAFPYETPSGQRFDSGDYRRALDEALRLAGYEEVRREQAVRRARRDRRQLGVGISSYVEITGFVGREFAHVAVGDDGAVAVRVGTSSHGQGHETAFAQIASSVLGIPLDRVRVIHSDTAAVPRGEGTFGSRSLQVAGSNVLRAAELVAEKARRIAAHVLEVAPEDLVPAEGSLAVVGAPDRGVAWAELARIAADPVRLPEGIAPGLAAEGDFVQPAETFPFGSHVAVVEVDVETGEVRLLRHVAVDDCGRILNPVLVDGQVHGGAAQGIAQALFEGVEHDELGNPLTANLATYLVPSAAELPEVTVAHTETPTPLNPLGAKGIGESATIGATPAVVNAAVDALAHLGVRHLDPPLSPERVWRAIRAASGSRAPS